jgi:hypothetical protein
MNTKETDGINRDEIARLAYLKWECDGRPEGRSLQHWLDAEQHLRTAKHLVADIGDAPVKGKTRKPKPSGGRKVAGG